MKKIFIIGSQMRLKLWFIILLFSSLVHAETQTGYGWDIPNSSLNVGGYLDMTYDDTRVDDFLFNDIALIVSGRQNRFDLLAEVELSHISLEGKSNQSGDLDLNIERLQLSYALNDMQTVRIGRFNSDIGYWNQAPITILQDTTTRPHLVGNFFPMATTGVHFQQHLNSEHQLSVTYQNNDDISHQEGEVLEVNKHIGFAYLGVNDEFSWRLSLGEYEDVSQNKFDYVGLGADYDVDDLTLQGEFFLQKSDSKKERPYSGYLQSTWHLKPQHDTVVRFERYDDKVLNIEENIYLLGYVYRPTQNLSAKVEYVYHSELPLNRFVYSLSVLF